jgi:hypothetical protein
LANWPLLSFSDSWLAPKTYFVALPVASKHKEMVSREFGKLTRRLVEAGTLAFAELGRIATSHARA